MFNPNPTFVLSHSVQASGPGPPQFLQLASQGAQSPPFPEALNSPVLQKQELAGSFPFLQTPQTLFKHPSVVHPPKYYSQFYAEARADKSAIKTTIYCNFLIFIIYWISEIDFG